ncbi:hypothetical protein [Acinetobacter baumannii]|uniref:Uncharacterized protein n=1 Tax=Acinetobacter baumannii TaxID=470 RepID=A0A5N5XUW0_ACIBA|nr:hypothetical protein [Acinetobacter baumannii]KAB8126239.1 hypothetical protein FDO31_19170 [Acinetobacter baumannii]MQR19929.1 hypothetical protein [Acinetobacter baumannii]MQR51206.1 hypothetical protein [Acinetobacter baumannii]
MDISYELLKTAIRLATNGNQVRTANIVCTVNHQTGVQYIIINAELDFESSPIVYIAFLNPLKIYVKVPPSYNPVTGLHTDEYIFFHEFLNFEFDELSFINKCNDFWLKKTPFKQQKLF